VTINNVSKAEYPKHAMDSSLGAVRTIADGLRDLLAQLDVRIAESMVDSGDDEICYTELWLRQVRERLEEVDKRVGTIRQMNWKRALQQWYSKEVNLKMYGHSFSLKFEFIPGMPKDQTAERGKLIEWLKAGNRMDCLVMDEYTGDWVFDFKKMQALVNEMLSKGNRPPDSITLHPQPKILVRADK